MKMIPLTSSKEIVQSRKTFTLIGKIVNLVTHERIKNVLTVMTGYKTSQAATNLNKKASFHQPDGSELEKNYREHIPVVNISMKKVMRCL